MNIWFISDTHFGHENIIRFVGANGHRIRPGFATVEEMDETMIEAWNKVVKPHDKVYHLGDVAFTKATIERVMPRLNGSKRLIMGNHDTLDATFYRQYFGKVMAYRHFTEDDGALVCTHFPLHPMGFLNRFDGRCVNVHGHIHEKTMRDGPIPDERYVNVCVEHTNYAPVHYDWLMARVRRAAA